MADATDVRANNSPERKADPVDRAIGRIAGRQFGVVGRRQLLHLGLEPQQIKYRVRCGRLHPLYRAVYAVGHNSLTREARRLAAVMTSGPDAELSHHTAAAHWGTWQGAAGLHVTVPSQRRPQPGITLHHARIQPDEITTHEGIPTTGVSRTILDLAPALRPRQLERLLSETERLRLTDTVTLTTLLTRYPRRPGSAAIRALLSSEPQLTRSELEVMFLEFADELGLPERKTNHWVCGYELDVYWPEHGLAVELDSFEHHAHRAAFESDRERIRVLKAADIACIPVTARQLRHTRPALERDLREFLKCPA